MIENLAKEIATTKPFTDRDGCIMRKMNNHRGYFSSIAFNCFVEPADQPLKIDIDLLYSLPFYMLNKLKNFELS